jgi:hypothetical protein
VERERESIDDFVAAIRGELKDFTKFKELLISVRFSFIVI